MNLEKICNAATAVVLDAASFIREEFGKVNSSEIEHKDNESLVSYVDKNAEIMLVGGLSKVLPQATFLTEEGTVEARSGEWQWVIDPLDGTTNFLHGVPVFAVSVGLSHNGTIVAGLIADVMRSQLYTAWKGGGAFLDGIPISVSSRSDFNDGLFATGFPYGKFDWLEDYFRILTQLVANTRGVRRLGAAAIDMAYTACGIFEGYYEYRLNPWDVAAGIIIVQEAGGQVSDFKGGADYLDGKQIVVSNGLLHKPLLDLLKIHL